MQRWRVCATRTPQDAQRRQLRSAPRFDLFFFFIYAISPPFRRRRHILPPAAACRQPIDAAISPFFAPPLLMPCAMLQMQLAPPPLRSHGCDGAVRAAAADFATPLRAAMRSERTNVQPRAAAPRAAIRMPRCSAAFRSSARGH